MKILKTMIAAMATAAVLPMTSIASPMKGMTFTGLNNIIYCADGMVSESHAMTVLSGYERLPEIVKQKIANNGIRVYVYPRAYEQEKEAVGKAVSIAKSASKGIYTDQYGNTTIFVTKPAEVYIYTDVLDRLGNKTVVHEIGHVIDDLYDLNKVTDYNASSDASFLSLANKYKTAIAAYDELSAQNTYDTHEIYAECFRILVENPGYLYINAPELYNYLVYTVNKI